MAIAMTFAMAGMVSFASPVKAFSSTGYQLPWKAGVAYPITQSWGGTYSHTGVSHYAYDIGMPSGTPVLAARPGKVVAVRTGSTVNDCKKTSNIDQANYVRIQHDSDTESWYWHLSSASVKVGDTISQGQEIGRSGNTGWSCGAHLHFQVWDVSAHATAAYYFNEAPNTVLQLNASYTSENLLPYGTVIVDDLRSGFNKTGTAAGWHAATAGYEGHMWWTYTQTSSLSDDKATWTPNLPQAGNYQVFVFVPNTAAGAVAKYSIYHAGETAFVNVNQANYGNVWVSLGTFNFNAGTNHSVFLGDSSTAAGVQIGFDAVKFVLV